MRVGRNRPCGTRKRMDSMYFDILAVADVTYLGQSRLVESPRIPRALLPRGVNGARDGDSFRQTPIARFGARLSVPRHVCHVERGL